MLLQVLDVIRREQVVSRQKLARELNIDEQTLQPMLDVWLSKGCIRPCQPQKNCKGSCLGCGLKQMVYYQTVE